MRRKRLGNRGVLLISSYLILSAFLIYSNILTLRAIGQRLNADVTRNGFQAMDLAQAAAENFREELYITLMRDYSGSRISWNINTAEILAWLDKVGTNTEPSPPLFDPNNDGVRDQWLCLTNLPTIKNALTGTVCSSGKTGAINCACTAAAAVPKAHIVSIETMGEDVNGNHRLDEGEDTNKNGVLDIGAAYGAGPLSPRLVTLEASATMNGITKTIRAGYLFQLSSSDIFRYAYFVNNFGWMEPPDGQRWMINGDVRANGDLFFGSNSYGPKITYPAEHLWVQGNLYASVNPDVQNPFKMLPSNGRIDNADLLEPEPTRHQTSQVGYWNEKRWMGAARPARHLTLPSQPAIGGTQKVLPEGEGWDTVNPLAQFQPKQFKEPKPLEMPYLGDLSYYKQIAAQQGSSLTIGGTTIVSQVYKGPDGVAGNADDKKPLVLIGTAAQPIEINGPVVVPGDVIIKGYVKGRGTIYAGRNVHIIGHLEYTRPFMTPAIERDPTTGTIQLRGENWDPNADWQTRLKLGKVCDDGTYVPPNPDGSIPAGGC